MICLLTMAGQPAKTNDEFREVLKRRKRIFQWMLVLAFLTSAIAAANEVFLFLGENSWVNGLYSGMGVGVGFVAVWKLFQTEKIMKSEELLKEERLKRQDERNRLIAGKAMQTAMTVGLILAYVIMMIAGLYNRIIFFCFWFILVLFFLLFRIFTIYYGKKL